MKSDESIRIDFLAWIESNRNIIFGESEYLKLMSGGSEGSRPTPAPAHGRFYTYVLNNIDVVITITYSQKYVLFEIMYTTTS